MKTLNATQFDKYTPEHDAIMSTNLVPVLGAFDLYAEKGFPISVKVPESFTFVEFKSGWDQDDYIHNDLANQVCRHFDLKFKTVQEYPRYSPPGKLHNSLRYFFENESAAMEFIDQIKSMMEGE